jgi:DNA-binding FadR family transcriptional regulator
MAQNQPMYRHIADDLRAQIAEGKLAQNKKLPTEGELSDQYRASRNTVREAIRRLTDEGLLESRPGQGTFVARKVDPFVTVLTADPKTGFGGGERLLRTCPRYATCTGSRRPRSLGSRWCPPMPQSRAS